MNEQEVLKHVRAAFDKASKTERELFQPLPRRLRVLLLIGTALGLAIIQIVLAWRY